MILRSHPQLLLLEGELLRMEKIIASYPCEAITVYGITPDNVLESLGTFNGVYELSVPCTSKYVIVYWTYDTGQLDDGSKILPLITVITNGTIQVSC